MSHLQRPLTIFLTFIILLSGSLVALPHKTFAQSVNDQGIELRLQLIGILTAQLEQLRSARANQEASTTESGSTSSDSKKTCHSSVPTNNPGILKLDPLDPDVTIFPTVKIKAKVFNNETIITVKKDDTYDIFSTKKKKKKDIIKAIFKRYHFPDFSIVDPIVKGLFQFSINNVITITEEPRASKTSDRIPEGKFICN